MTKTLIVVVGPTAVGKTKTCISLAQHYGSAIVSADSRQFYREMNTGTAKPSPEELQLAQHYLVDHLSIHQPYTVKDFEQDALEAIGKIHTSTDIAILSGGSGLFVKAVCEGLDEIPDIPASYRTELVQEYEQTGAEPLLRQLQLLDPEYYATVDRSNTQRVIRALEVIRHTGKPFSAFRKNLKALRPFNLIKIGLILPRAVLYDRINTRMDEMINSGLFEEAKALHPFKTLNALQTVGYSEIFGYLDGEYDKEEAIRLLKRNSRRYAKRQLTWFNKDQEITWFSPEALGSIVRHIDNMIKRQS